jgi:hypothetical protein
MTEQLGEVTPITQEEADARVKRFTDIFLRIIQGETLLVIYNTCFTTLNTVAQTLPEEGRKELANFAQGFYDHLTNVNFSKENEPKEASNEQELKH